jgi:nucleoside-diphosphate-sugar epimerase
VILVTGGTGFIGSHLLDRLADAGEPVRALVRPQTARAQSAQPQTARPQTLRGKTALPHGVEAVSGDLATGEGLTDAARGADTIIHIAGVLKALTPEDYYRGNTRATENLARVAAECGTRFVHVSSLAVCGPSPADGSVNEDSETRPMTHYGKSKLEAERILRSLLPQAVIVRPPVVYGPRDTGVFPFLKSIARGVELQIAGGERWFSAIYVRDLVDGILAASTSPRAPGRTYFLSHAQPVNWSHLGDATARLVGRKRLVLRVPVSAAYGIGYLAELWSALTRKPGMVSREKIDEATCARWVCDSRRAATELGFEAKTSLDAGLAETLAWYKEAGWVKY